MKKMPLKRIISVSAISAAVILGVGFILLRMGPYIPQEFFQERIAGAGTAKNIARMVSDSLANLAQIEAFDKANRIEKAQALVDYEHKNGQEKQNAAVMLAGNLEKMAQFTKKITPLEARQVSVEAVTMGVAMVSHLINYNNSLNQLLIALNTKFAAKYGRSPYSGPSVKDIVANMNSEARDINDLNQRFNAALADFDQKFVK